MTVRTAQLFIGSIPLPAVDAFLYQVPATKRTILKDITLFDTAGTTCQIGVRLGGGPTVLPLFRRTLTAGIDTHIPSLFVVLNSGDIVTGRSSLTTTLIVGLGGAELQL